jgi:probable rRNA maturation factor
MTDAAELHAIDVFLPEDQSESEEAHAFAERLRLAAETALDTAEAGPGELTIALTQDEEVRALNRQFRGADKPTNVLSFPAEYTAPEPGAPPYLGDVILARETVAREADAQGKSFLDHATHLVVHGVLHLLGHTHDADEDSARMESLEVAALARLGLPDPYAETTLAET